MQVQNLEAPQKGAKNMQNLAWFQTSSKFDHKYLQIINKEINFLLKTIFCRVSSHV